MIETVQWSPELGRGAPTVGIVYGFRVRSSGEYRYIGLITKGLRRRVGEHRKVARDGRKTPFHDWLRKTADDAYEVVVLERVVTTREDLGQAEISWISLYRATGDRLLNLSDGGLGPTGVVWTAEQREAASRRSKGRPGISRPGELNPMWGHAHTDEQKARWAASRKGSNAGQENPNFGKFGSEHPAYGRVLSAETKKRLSEQKQGDLNPNFGKTASEETRAKMSAVRKRPADAVERTQRSHALPHQQRRLQRDVPALHRRPR